MQYGLNSTSESGSWTGPFTAGSGYTESVTGLTNGSTYVVYIRGCNEAGLCGPWSNASNQVSPYGPPAAPSVSAVANGTSITYNWGGGGGGGRGVTTYHVCIDGGCTNYSGSGTSTVGYGYSQTHTITAYVVDSAGQQSGTSSASATTVSAQPTVSVTKGNYEVGSTKAGGACAGNSSCYDFYVSVANFTVGATLTYSCIDGTDNWWTATQSWSGSTVKANNSFYTQCLHYPDGSTVTISVSDGSHSASGSYRT